MFRFSGVIDIFIWRIMCCLAFVIHFNSSVYTVNYVVCNITTKECKALLQCDIPHLDVSFKKRLVKLV